MANYSKLLSIISGSNHTIDFSSASNVLELSNIQMDGSTSGHVVFSASATTSTYSIIWPATQAASSGYVLTNDGTGQLSWSAASSSGVSSVALSLPSSVFNVSGSPVTSSGTLSGSFANQSANAVFAGPSNGSAATPSFRSLVAADIPSLSTIYLPLAGGTMSGSINGGGFEATNFADPTASQSLATKNYVVTTTISSGLMTTKGDIIYENATPAPARLPIGSTGQILTVVSGLPAWAAPATVSLTSGVSGILPVANGGTNSNTALNNNRIMVSSGGSIIEGAALSNGQIFIGSTGNAPVAANLTAGSGVSITSSAGGITIAATGSGGTVTSVALADGSSTPIFSISGSPVTSSGTLTQTLVTQSANTVFAGPTSGSAAQPLFRALVAADIPSLSATYLPLVGGTMSGSIAMGGNQITGLPNPVANGEALRYDQLGVATSGSAIGIATLDTSGKIPVSQLPSVVMEYQQAWNPSTNTPTLADGSGTNGGVYRVSTAYTGSISGLTDPSMSVFYVGDLVIYSSTVGKYQRAPSADGVTSVNGAVGAVTVNAINQLTGDVTASAASGSQSKATTVAAIQGTTVSGTTGSGNVVFSASPTFTGLISGASASFSSTISASNFSGSSSGTNSGDQTITLTGNVTGSGTGSFATTIANSAVTASMIATGAFDQVTITGGAGTAASVAQAPALKRTLIAGQSFSANTSYAVRWGITANGETAGRVYAADITTSSYDLFYVIGMASSSSAVSAGGNILVTTLGSFALSSADTAFASNTDGAPVFLSSNGTFTLTAPTTSGQAVTRIGIVSVRSATVTSNIIDVHPVPVGVS